MATIMSVTLVAVTAFGGNHILNVQSIGGEGIDVDLASASFSTGNNVTVNDAAIATQGGDGTEDRVVKEFSREDPFSMVALTWEGERDIAAFVRAERADGTWSQWYEMDAAANTEEMEKHGTDPIFVEPTTRIQVSTANVDLLDADRAESEAATTADDIEAVFIDGGEGTVQGDIAPVADSYSWGMPKIVSRSGWGAQSSGRTPDYTEPTKAITVHHTAGSNDYTEAQAPGIVRGIQGYHMNQGWGDVGYNALVDKYGNIYEGRAGGLDRGPMGAHVGSFNSNTWGISMLGNYQLAQPTAKSIDAMGEIIGWKSAQAGINPLGSTKLTASGNFQGSKYSAGQTGTFPTINAHRDFHYNSCPGDYLYSQMGAIRNAANAKANQLRAGTTTPAPAPSSTEAPKTTEPAGQPQGPATTITNLSSLPAVRNISLSAIAQGDPDAIAGAAGTLAGLVVLYASQTGVLQKGIEKVEGIEIIPGFTLSQLSPYIKQILQFVGADDAAEKWTQFESKLGTLAGTAAGIGGNNFAFYSNGIGVENEQGDIFTLVGTIADAWMQQGLDAGPLGLPISEEYNLLEDDVKVDFEGGSISYNPETYEVNIDVSSH